MVDAHLRPSTGSPTRWRFTFVANQAQVAAAVKAAGVPELAGRPVPLADFRLEMN